jgi:hypothetical protein
LTTHDSQTITVSSQGSNVTQTGIGAIEGVAPPTAFALLASLMPQFTFGPTGASVTIGSQPGPNGGLTLTASTPDGTQTETISATAGYTALHVGQGLAFETTATGFDPSWALDLSAGSAHATFTEIGSDDEASYTTTITP